MLNKGDNPPHPAHCQVAALPKRKPSTQGQSQNYTDTTALRHYLSTGCSCPSLHSRCPKQIATLSVRRVSRNHFASSHFKPLCRGIVEWRSTRLVTHTAANLTSRNLAPSHWKRCRKTQIGAKSCSSLLQSAYHKTSSACSLSGSPNVCSQVRSVVFSTNSSHLGLH